MIMHTVPQRALDCSPGICGLSQVMGPTNPHPLFTYTSCIIRHQHDILKTAVADVSKRQRDMSQKGELQTLTRTKNETPSLS